MTDSPLVLYAPGLPDVAKAEYKYEQGLIPTLTRDPTIGLFSDTSAGKGAALNKAITDAQSDIFQGRKSLSDWDDVVKTWRKNGGDTIRSEYEKAYAAANG
jgi:putative aldouronate transport system substrate-binding protein